MKICLYLMSEWGMHYQSIFVIVIVIVNNEKLE